MLEKMTVEATLPAAGYDAALAGRVWDPNVGGPCVAAIRADGVFDVTETCATMSDLTAHAEAVGLLKSSEGRRIGDLDAILANTPEGSRKSDTPWLLAPTDLQAIKAAGVTFPKSMLERVIEEQAKGAPEKADSIRAEVQALIGGDLGDLKPGSKEAMALKEALIAQGAWSQYLEVGIGEDAEIFTKAQPMSAVGHGQAAGLHPRSTWNNPEPEVVLAINRRGEIIGATLGNDVNLRDFEGRSALLLSKAKDNNASAALGPFIRFFDSGFTLNDLRRTTVALSVQGEDGFELAGTSSMTEIARDPAELVEELMGSTHQYPDGAVLYLGTMFAPTKDRGKAGMGFTHAVGDVVTISAPELGQLTNLMTTSDRAPRWDYGSSDLMRHLATRGVLG